MPRLFPTVLVAILFVLSLSGCFTSAVRPPDLGKLYNMAAAASDEMRNPVIVIPGILGSRLKNTESGNVVWGAFGGRDYADPRDPEGARQTALPMGLGRTLDELVDNAEVVGALDRVEIRSFGVPLRPRAYAQILGTLGIGGYRDQQLSEAGVVDYGPDHFTCFQFAYDWRRSNAENARLLARFIDEKKQYVREQRIKRFGQDGGPVKFDIVAHSMGGLVTRYYLRYGDQSLPQDGSLPQLTWAGAQNVSRAILVGTPNAGSTHAVSQLVEGFRLAPLLPKYPSSILGTFPSIYELMPRSRHGRIVNSSNKLPVDDLYDPKLWQSKKWGLADPNETETIEWLLPDVKDPKKRQEIAIAHQALCLENAERFHKSLDVPASPPPGLDLHLFAGDSEPTLDLLAVYPDGSIEEVESNAGDGTVTRTSALMDERVGQTWHPGLESPIDWHSVQLIFTDHIGLTKDPVFSDNVLYLLLDAPRKKAS